MSKKIQAIVLDAMGVIYKSGDDVGELLIPFIKQNGGTSDKFVIEDLYLKASLGKISSAQFWHDVGLNSSLEDVYLQEHQLTEGVEQFLSNVKSKVDLIACLSNDVSEWSYKLRKKFALERYIDRWYISGNMGYRKPTINIYSNMLDDIALDPSNVAFIDDREKNISAAVNLGLHGILFGKVDSSSGVNICRNFQELTVYVSRII